MINYQELVFRLLLAVLLGGLVGLERERREWAAGLPKYPGTLPEYLFGLLTLILLFACLPFTLFKVSA